jgi:hypothetical protein
VADNVMKPFKITTRLAIQSVAHFDKRGPQQASFCVKSLLAAAGQKRTLSDTFCRLEESGVIEGYAPSASG